MLRRDANDFAFINQSEMDEWKNDLNRIPEQIEEKNKEIAENNLKLEKLNADLRELREVRIKPVATQIKTYEARLRVLKIPAMIVANQQKRDLNKAELERVSALNSQVSATVSLIDGDIEKLEKLLKIKRMREQIEKHQNSSDLHKSQIRVLQTNLESENSQAESVAQRLSSAQMELNINLQAQAQDQMNHAQASGSGYTSSQSSGYTSSQSSEYHSSNSASASGYKSSGGQSQGAHVYDDHERQRKIDNLKTLVSNLQDEHAKFKRAAANTLSSLEANRRDLDHDANEIRTLERKLNNFTQAELSKASKISVRDLNAQLTDKNDEKAPIEAKSNEFKAQLLRHQNIILAAEEKISELNADLKQSTIDSEVIKDNSDETDLQKTLELHRANMKPLQEEKQVLEGSIKKYENANSNARNDISVFNNNKARLLENKFANNYWNKPDVLLQELNDKIVKGLDEYELAHPANQSLKVRIALAQVETRYKAILSQKAKSGDNDVRREKYFQLCGLLWDSASYADEPTLTDKIKSILATPGTTYVGHELNALDQDEAVIQYKHFLKLNYDSLHAMDRDELNVYEEDQYNKAYKSLQEALEQLPNMGSHKELGVLVDRANDMLKAFDEHKSADAMKGGKEFDVKFHTSILRKATAWVRDPDNKVLKSDFESLVKTNQDGKPSTTKKVIGCCLMFLGALLTAASVVAKVMSFGVLAPVTIPGMAAGGLLVASGVGIFAHGFQKGEQRRMAKFASGVENYSESVGFRKG